MSGTESMRAWHDAATERYPTSVDALAAIRFRSAPAGWRWVAKACQVCRGWHVEQIRGQA